MKPSSPASLLLFLSLANAVPIRYSSTLPKDCLHFSTCQSWLRETFSPSSSNDHTPATRLPLSPHFPEHQLYPPTSSAEAHRELEEEAAAFNNAPLAPPRDQRPAIALSASRPLPSSYLLSLSYPTATAGSVRDEQATASTQALPSKPTSALPELHEEDMLRYWATVAEPSPQEPAVEVAELQVVQAGRGCGDMVKATFVRVSQPIILAREYSDLLVVGIVLLFLVAVVVMEAVEYFGASRCTLCFRDRRRGPIFLPDDEKPFSTKRSQFQPSHFHHDTKRAQSP